MPPWAAALRVHVHPPQPDHNLPEGGRDGEWHLRRGSGPGPPSRAPHGTAHGDASGKESKEGLEREKGVVSRLSTPALSRRRR